MRDGHLHPLETLKRRRCHVRNDMEKEGGVLSFIMTRFGWVSVSLLCHLLKVLLHLQCGFLSLAVSFSPRICQIRWWDIIRNGDKLGLCYLVMEDMADGKIKCIGVNRHGFQKDKNCMWLK
ncbi:hypothetical protein NPIL_404571 [Nephila pilipes]|uniref:Uncharacterized protein n=1 Tax=Nephila pilipes TaxID=299642 RepID=A0A8X6R3R7_NEPPI|nr:hypothetical protein NPIL_404571 [Nephila pilipes]